MVLVRDNAQHRMRRQCLVEPHGDPLQREPHQNDMFESLVATQLRQAHTHPVSLEAQRVMWEYDHALSLYPAPHALVMADQTEVAHHLYEEATLCMNPGSFGVDGSFLCWLPNATNTANAANASGLGEVEVSYIYGDDDEGDDE